MTLRMDRCRNGDNTRRMEILAPALDACAEAFKHAEAAQVSSDLFERWLAMRAYRASLDALRQARIEFDRMHLREAVFAHKATYNKQKTAERRATNRARALASSEPGAHACMANERRARWASGHGVVEHDLRPHERLA